MQVQQSSAIRTKTYEGDEILYILRSDDKPRLFFDGLFDGAISKPASVDPDKILIDPYLMNALNKRVHYKGETAWTPVVLVPESIYKSRGGDNLLPQAVYLTPEGTGNREWVADVRDLEGKIAGYRRSNFSDQQKEELTKDLEIQKENRMEAFRETLKEDLTLVYYKGPAKEEVPVLRFNLKK